VVCPCLPARNAAPLAGRRNIVDSLRCQERGIHIPSVGLLSEILLEIVGLPGYSLSMS